MNLNLKNIMFYFTKNYKDFFVNIYYATFTYNSI